MDLSVPHTAVAHFNARPGSNEQTNAMRLDSVGYSEGGWLTKSEHCSRKPLHVVGVPSNLSGKASRGLTGELVPGGGLHILEWPFIVASLRHTCAIIKPFNLHLDMPHL